MNKLTLAQLAKQNFDVQSRLRFESELIANVAYRFYLEARDESEKQERYNRYLELSRKAFVECDRFMHAANELHIYCPKTTASYSPPSLALCQGIIEALGIVY